MNIENIREKKAQTDAALGQAVLLVRGMREALKDINGAIRKPWQMWKEDLHNSLTRKSLFDGERNPRTLLSLIDDDFGDTYMKAWKAAPNAMRGLDKSLEIINRIEPKLVDTQIKVRSVTVPDAIRSASEAMRIKSSFDSAWASASILLDECIRSVEKDIPKIVQSGLDLANPTISLIEMLMNKIESRINIIDDRKIVLFREKRMNALKSAEKRVGAFLKRAKEGKKEMLKIKSSLPGVLRDLRLAKSKGSETKMSVDSTLASIASGQDRASSAAQRSSRRSGTRNIDIGIEIGNMIRTGHT